MPATAATTQVFHRHLHTRPPVAVAGKGMLLTDADGRSYIDASGGAAVSCLGHGHPDVLAAMHAQIDKLAYAHTSFFTTQVAEELANKLIAGAPDGMSHVYFVSGGSEAMEAAMKMARQYFVETGQAQRRHFIARRQRCESWWRSSSIKSLNIRSLGAMRGFSVGVKTPRGARRLSRTWQRGELLFHCGAVDRSLGL